MTEERMLPFVNKTWNPIAGGSCVEDGKIYACPYRCVYCWATILINKFPKGNLGKKYSGPYRIHEPAMKAFFKIGDFVAVQFMSDIGAPGIPDSVIGEVFKRMAYYPEVKFLLLTKNPVFYLRMKSYLPLNTILGATITSDVTHKGISKAWSNWKRLSLMEEVAKHIPHHDRFICIEPVQKMTPNFEERILRIKPRVVAVGYDNYENKLPEPKLKRTRILIEDLEENGVKVYEKTIRKAWDE